MVGLRKGEELEDYEREELAKLISEGYTNGRLDGDGVYIEWELKTNKWKED